MKAAGRKVLAIALFATAAMLGTPVSAQSVGVQKCDSKEEIVAISRRVVLATFPEFATNLETWTPVVADLGNAWKVSYLPPDPIFAGSPVVVFEKNICRVIAAFNQD